MGKKKVIIVGAGLAGLSSARVLAQRGRECLVFEKEDECGGLCRSKTINGFTFDYCGHLLHFKNPETRAFVQGLLGKDLVGHARSAWVHTRGRYIPYPFQANLALLPARVRNECLAGFAGAVKHSRTADGACKDFRSWVMRTFGPGIARHFMFPYNEKFWTVPPQQLTCAWLDGFIPVPTVAQAGQSRLSDSTRLGYNRRFWYLREGGISAFVRKLQVPLTNIVTGTAIRRIDLKQKRVFFNGGSECFDRLISTVALPQIPELIDDLPADVRTACRKLRFTSVFNLNLGLARAPAPARHWVYFPEKEYCFYRVGFPHCVSASLAPKGAGSLSVEVSYSKERPLDRGRVVGKILDGLRRAGLLRRSDRILAQDAVDIPFAYIIHDRNHAASVSGIRDYLRRRGVVSVGRYGSWRYFSMEDALWDGKRAADLITPGIGGDV